jgi:hypothetical protein
MKLVKPTGNTATNDPALTPRAWMNENALKVMFYYLFNKQTDLFIKVISLFTFQKKSLMTNAFRNGKSKVKLRRI